MVGRQAADELAGVGQQQFALALDRQQIVELQPRIDLQRLEPAMRALPLPTRRQALLPVDGRLQRRQQGFQALEQLLGAVQEGLQG